MAKVDITDYEKKKKKSKRTVFKYRPKTNKVDKTLEKVSKSLNKDIFITSGDRSPKSSASRKNHSNQKARDIGVNSNPQLTQEDRENIAAQASLDGLRVGTDDRHTHLDSRYKERRTKIFTEDGNRENKVFKRARIADDDKRGLYNKARDLPKKKVKSDIPKLSLSDKLKGLSQIDPTGSNKKENIEAVLENDPTKLVPQITKDTPRLAMRQDLDGTPLERDIVFKQKKKEQTKLAKAISSNPEAVKELAVSKVQEPELKAEVLQDIQAKEQGAPRQGGPASQFTEALQFFLPQIIGGLAGAALEGTDGAIGGIQQAGAARDAFLKHQQNKEELDIKRGVAGQKQMQKDEDQALRAAELKASQERQKSSEQFKGLNLAARLEELKQGAKRTKNLEENRKIQREIMTHERAVKNKDTFQKRADVLKDRESLRQLDSLRDLADVEVLPGTIGFKIAKGIAGEVGNLTEEEREASQISPSLYRRAKRYASTTFKGKIPKEDIAELKLVSDAIGTKIKGRLGKKVDDFARSRGKHLSPDLQKSFREDIMIESGLDISKKTIMSPEQKARLEELRRKHR